MSRRMKIAAACVGVPILLIIVLIIVVHTYDYNRLKPRIASAVQNATGRELTMAGDIVLDFGFSPALVVERVALENAKWGSKPEMVSCERFELKVALLPLISGDIRVKRLVLVRPTLLVEKSKTGQFNYALDTKAEKAPQKVPDRKEGQTEGRAMPGLEVNRVHIEGAELVYKDHATGSGLTASIERMRASAESMHAPLDFDLRGAFKDIPFSLSGEVGSLQSLVRGKDMPFRLNAQLAGAKALLEGHRTVSGTKSGFSARVDVQADSLEGINESAGTDLPRNVPFSLAAAVSSTDMQRIKVERLELELGESVISGEANVDLGGSVPAVQASLRSEELDVRPFLPKENSGNGKKTPTQKKNQDSRTRVLPDTPLAADFLHQVDAAVRTEIGRLLLPEMRCDNIRADLGLANGELRMDPLRLEMAGGSLEGVLGLRDLKQGLAVNTKLQLANIQLKRLMAMAGHRDFLLGDLETHLDLAASGRSLAGLMGAMKGDATVILGEGKVDSAYLDKVGGQVLSTLRRYIDPEKKSEEYTRINCLVSAFDMRKGVARSRVILLDTEKMQLMAEGKVDLGTEQLDFSFDPSPKMGLDSGTLGEIGLSLSELSKPFKLSGTLAKPSLALDVKSAALTLGRVIDGARAGGAAGAASSLLSGSGGEGTTCSQAIAVARGERKPAKKQPAKKEERAKEGSDPGSEAEKGLRELEKRVRDLF